METITNSMTHDHRRCDEIFVNMEQAIIRKEWRDAEQLMGEFVQSMEHHFEIEEGKLFPVLEEMSSQASGPVNVMIMEHDQLRHLISQLNSAISKELKELAAELSDTLLVTMQQHNMKEENVLYPMADRIVPDLSVEIASHLVESC
ncbi:MAG: hemerythrin domain-containing protein [Candidatus Thiodiazotropha sp. (ex Myrtea sp. 'scaly one' KF741663)]|nr:hemerythrin domain-containing protein [Candidatus Thiodiazotropha sp. (ex Myrtea sp. 'scaly one' KF741663)]